MNFPRKKFLPLQNTIMKNKLIKKNTFSKKFIEDLTEILNKK